MKRLILLAVLAVAVLSAGESAWAQRSQGPSSSSISSLPPALRAAILSGNSAAVAQAISTLSGGNPTTAAALATATIAAAEQMLATNPQAAVEAATAAVEIVNSTPIIASSPSNVETVLTTAARIFVNPTAQAVAPTATAELASATLTVASATGNSTLIGAVATAAVSTAEKLLATDPSAAVTLAGQAVQAITGINGATPATEQVLTTAARIVISPSASGVSPTILSSVTNAIQTAGGTTTGNNSDNGNGKGEGQGPVNEETRFTSGSAT